ncbi:hypothetical protein GH714_026954 [Hevea brasiliensis]|uniref:Protein kinase domain-containing protein n=1 Tax=Hevea brasiliensis TaxID=3981 RepID=A0A6A6M148_HEVBR|nr:hypothetical protein GH714_026954 [Hevea brasiliensis]
MSTVEISSSRRLTVKMNMILLVHAVRCIAFGPVIATSEDSAANVAMDPTDSAVGSPPPKGGKGNPVLSSPHSTQEWILALVAFYGPMEKRRYSPELTKVTAMLLLLSFGFHPIIVQCQESGTNMTSHLSTQTPSPSRPPHLNTELKRILLSIVLGVLTGLTGAIICACVVRCLVCYMNRTPILKGPVIFSPKISPKTLQSALASENQLLVSNSNGKYYRTVLDNGLTVAVKRLEPFESGSQERQSKSAKRRIQQELGRLASLRHRNLMSLRAYVRESDRRDPTDPFFGEAASGGSLGRWLLHLQQAGEASEH